MNSPRTLRRLYTEREVALLLRVSQRTIQRLRAEGRIAYVTQGRRPLFTESDVQDYIRSQRHAAVCVSLPRRIHA